QPDLYEKICQIINETGIEPAWLGLEVTESSVMQNVDYAVCVLTELKKLGVHLSVDDFGTGYSSLSYLKKFPIDLLKIDRSFITDIPKDSDDIAIVSAVVSMAHNLNLKVLAEGVETLEQKDFLHSVSCDEFQGFYFSRPVAAHHILQ
ncbi:MAG: EAL domain-containing protein, partial [Desulfuromonadales bacterium]|nr:EAL domain-containing protein [Desulfuromonadales bacterium]